MVCKWGCCSRSTDLSDLIQELQLHNDSFIVFCSHTLQIRECNHEIFFYIDRIFQRYHFIWLYLDTSITLVGLFPIILISNFSLYIFQKHPRRNVLFKGTITFWSGLPDVPKISHTTKKRQTTDRTSTLVNFLRNMPWDFWG